MVQQEAKAEALKQKLQLKQQIYSWNIPAGQLSNLCLKTSSGGEPITFQGSHFIVQQFLLAGSSP